MTFQPCWFLADYSKLVQVICLCDPNMISTGCALLLLKLATRLGLAPGTDLYEWHLEERWEDLTTVAALTITTNRTFQGRKWIKFRGWWQVPRVQSPQTVWTGVEGWWESLNMISCIHSDGDQDLTWHSWLIVLKVSPHPPLGPPQHSSHSQPFISQALLHFSLAGLCLYWIFQFKRVDSVLCTVRRSSSPRPAPGLGELSYYHAVHGMAVAGW